MAHHTVLLFVLVGCGGVAVVAATVAGVLRQRSGDPAPAGLARQAGRHLGTATPASPTPGAHTPGAPTAGVPTAAAPLPRLAPAPTAVFADQIQPRVVVADPRDPEWRPGYVHGVRVDGPRVTAIGSHVDDGSPWTMSVPANRPFVVHVPPQQDATAVAQLSAAR